LTQANDGTTPDIGSSESESAAEDASEQIQYLGGGLTHTEKNNLMEFNCDTVISGNEDFGP